MLQSNAKLKSLIDELWNQFWSGGISNPLTAIQQITYMIFMKRLDDLEAKRERDAEWNNEEFKSRFSGTYNPYVDESNYKLGKGEGGTFWFEEQEQLDKALEEARKPRPAEELRWSYFSNFPADKMLNHVRFNVFPFLKQLNGGTSPFTKHMANAVFVIEKPSLLVEAVKKIEQIFIEIQRDAEEGGQAFQDIQGDVYEMLLSEIATAGKNGQFRTPRHIIKLMAELIEPKLGEKICDPACGTAGFLLGAYQYILSDLVRKKAPEKLITDEDGFERGTISSVLTEDVKKQLENDLIGFDIDSSMVRLGLMNLMMHGIDNPNIDYTDTLSKKYNQDAEYDVIMANPPFSGNIDKGDINTSLKLPTTRTELLFLERIYNMLRKGKRAAVIIPQGVLSGTAKAFVETRKILIERCQLEGVIALPSGVFKPYAGVSTAILIFTKVYNPDDSLTEPATQKTWFYDMEKDGYELNDKRAPLMKEGRLRDYGDLQDIVHRYKNRNSEDNTDRTLKHFSVPFEEIKSMDYDLTFQKYNKDFHEEVIVKDPVKLFENLESMEENIQKELKTLKEMIG
ncbi:type I restriction-modification system subunit M [Bizionia myxarmorum]|uniref:site-specific DNA-methyltransferase (adenine-specific) n=1 Tax=Bizionia myxarmorum TaxID=291186 RepID=A0A5D0R6G5_9FLAO|nr:type I restriction-modification system subunit M [Bizionia myxarmorum]TYB76461.1 N-6 DNA methylase [Bizionia myxarmorum]